MKSNPRILMFVLPLALVFFACGAVGPGDTVEEFFDSIQEGQIDQAMSYLDPSFVQQWGRDKVRSAMVTATRDMQEKGGIEEFEILEEQEVGEVGDVRYRLVYGNGTEEVDNVELVRIDGEWKMQPTTSK